MRFAGGGVDVGLPSACSLLVIAPPCFVQIFATYKQRYSAAHFIYSTGLASHAQNGMKRMSSWGIAL